MAVRQSSPAGEKRAGGEEGRGGAAFPFPHWWPAAHGQSRTRCKWQWVPRLTVLPKEVLGLNQLPIFQDIPRAGPVALSPPTSVPLAGAGFPLRPFLVLSCPTRVTPLGFSDTGQEHAGPLNWAQREAALLGGCMGPRPSEGDQLLGLHPGLFLP